MDICVTKQDLNHALQITQSVVAKRTTMPILANLLLSVSNGQLRISASDLEVSIVASVKAEVRAAGSTTVNARVFSDIVRELPDAEVNIRLLEGERVEVIAKGSKFKIIGTSAEEYPTLPGLTAAVSAKLSGNLLLEMINKTLYAASFDETRFNLNGVCFEILEEAQAGSDKNLGESGTRALRMVATDGHRLALIARPVKDFSFAGRVIVPRKGLSEMRKILDSGGENEVGAAINEGFFVLEAWNFKIAIRLIDGEYPDYSQVIPSERGQLVLVDNAELVQALRRVMLMVTDREKCVKMHFSPGVLRISSSSPELGEASEEIPAEYEGEALTAGFNAVYLLDAAAAMGLDRKMAAELHGELGPGKFYIPQDEASLAIVMPMRL